MISELLEKLKAASKLRTESQDALLVYCRDQSVPLCERFPVWVDFVDKIEKQWVIGSDEFLPIGKWVDSHNPYEYNKYEVYTWETFLGYVEDAIENPEYCNGWIEPITSVVEFKEILIQHNFGSFCNDW